MQLLPFLAELHLKKIMKKLNNMRPLISKTDAAHSSDFYIYGFLSSVTMSDLEDHG